MARDGLYFIAIMPPDDIAQRVQAIKKEFVDTYNSSEAYGKPPHFTLHPPFKAPEDIEEVVIPQLIFFAKDQQPFQVELSGFNHFRNDVIYIDLAGPAPMQALHGDLEEYLQNEMGFSDRGNKNSEFTPHMTVAYRDLSPENFERAWQEFGSRNFNYSFEVGSIFLLKHDYQRWQPFYEFKFGA